MGYPGNRGQEFFSERMSKRSPEPLETALDASDKKVRLNHLEKR
jgi:hypothetical protein